MLLFLLYAAQELIISRHLLSREIEQLLHPRGEANVVLEVAKESGCPRDRVEVMVLSMREQTK